MGRVGQRPSHDLEALRMTSWPNSSRSWIALSFRSKTGSRLVELVFISIADVSQGQREENMTGLWSDSGTTLVCTAVCTSLTCYLQLLLRFLAQLRCVSAAVSAVK